MKRLPMDQAWDCNFGKRMRNLRREARLTQRDMAAAMGISPYVYQRHELGTLPLPANKVLLVAKVLQIWPSTLLGMVEKDLGDYDTARRR